MSRIIESACPLCKSAAKYDDHYARHSKHFVCPTCKEFVIKTKAERYVIESADQTRQTLSDFCAKVKLGDVTLLSFEPNGSNSAPAVLAEYLSLQVALER